MRCGHRASACVTALLLAATAGLADDAPSPLDPRPAPWVLGWSSEPAMDLGGRTVDSIQRGISEAFSGLARQRPAVAVAWEIPLGLVLSLVQHEVNGHGGRAREFELRPSYGFGFDLSAYTTIARTPENNLQVSLISVGGSEANTVLARRVLLDLHAAGGVEGASFALALATKIDLTNYVLGTPSPTDGDSRTDFTDGYREGNDIAVYLVSRQALRRDVDPQALWEREYAIDFADPQLADDWDEVRAAALWNLLDPALVTGAFAYFRDHLGDGQRRIRAPGLRLAPAVRLGAGTRGILGPESVSRALDLHLSMPAALLTLTLRDLQANGSTSWGSGLRLHALRLGGNWRMGLVAETWEEPDGVRSLPAGVESWHWGGEISGNLGGGVGIVLQGGTKDFGYLPGLPLAEGAYLGAALSYQRPAPR